MGINHVPTTNADLWSVITETKRNRSHILLQEKLKDNVFTGIRKPEEK